jgi:hypothetical protein
MSPFCKCPNSDYLAEPDQYLSNRARIACKVGEAGTRRATGSAKRRTPRRTWRWAFDGHFHARGKINTGCRWLGEPEVRVAVVEEHVPFGVNGAVFCDSADADELEDGLADD